MTESIIRCISQSMTLNSHPMRSMAKVPYILFETTTHNAYRISKSNLKSNVRNSARLAFIQDFDDNLKRYKRKSGF